MSTCTAERRNDTTDPFIVEFREKWYEIVIPILTAFGAMVMVTNIYILIGSCYIKLKTTATLVLTISLALSDTWTSVILCASFLTQSYLPFVLRVIPFCPYEFCVGLAMECFRMGGLITSVYHLLTMSINHYINIARPFTHTSIMTKRVTMLVVCLQWLAPPLGFLTYYASFSGHGFRTKLCHVHGTIEPFHYSGFRIGVALLIAGPLIIMSVLYSLAVHTLSKLSNQMTETTAIKPKNAGHVNARRGSVGTVIRHRNVVVTSVLILGTFCLGWLPTIVLFLLSCDGCALDPKKATDFRQVFALSLIVQTMILLKSFINPIIYAIRIPEFQEALRTMHGCKRARYRYLRTISKNTTASAKFSLRSVETSRKSSI